MEVKPKSFDPAKRPKLGLGVMILNEFDEIITSQRILPGHAFHDNWQFPGGFLEFGETFEECAAREVLEECGVQLDQTDIKYITTMNVRYVEIGYHNVGLFMVSIKFK